MLFGTSIKFEGRIKANLSLTENKDNNLSNENGVVHATTLRSPIGFEFVVQKLKN